MAYVGDESWILGTTWIDHDGKKWKFLEDGTFCFGPFKNHHQHLLGRPVEVGPNEYAWFRFSIIGGKFVTHFQKVADIDGTVIDRPSYICNKNITVANILISADKKTLVIYGQEWMTWLIDEREQQQEDKQSEENSLDE